MKLRKKFLIELLEKDNPSGMESVITPMVVQELNNLGFKVSLDDIGNISAIRGSATKYPLFNAHLDQVDFVDYGSYTTWYNKDSKSTKDTYSYYDDDFLDWDDIDDLEKVVGCLSTEELADVFTCDDCFKRAKCPNYEYKMLCDNFDANYSSYDKLAKFAVREWGWTPKEKDKPQQLALKFMVYESKGKLYGTGGRVLGGDDKAGIFNR
jgi:hypothetical protein